METNLEITKESKNKNKKSCHNNPTAGAVYGLGLIGAAVYYISMATGFWMGVLGVLKAIVWPAFMVYELLQYLNM